MLEILTRLCNGKGRKGDLQKLETLSGITVEGSLCGLGKTAPNPVSSSLRYYRDEYEAHINGVCPAKKCTALIRYDITDTCFGCTPLFATLSDGCHSDESLSSPRHPRWHVHTL